MKQIILPSLAIAALIISSSSLAQKNTAYAITGPTKGNFTWNVIREINLSTGEVVRTIYDPAVTKSINVKALENGGTKSTISAATGVGVAATAFDAAHNRLYFTNMRGNDLSYLDLSSPELSVVINNNPAFNSGNKFDEGNVITRMAFASDGLGYAITNNGNSLISFTTDEKPTVTNLGELIDGKKNGSMSIHSQCSSWGGDMVGDAYGNLYLVSYRNHLFKINPQTRVADHLGQLKGLPAEFTSNGMVVTDDGDLIVTSATLSDNYYKVNISTLEATVLNKKEDKVYNASDLANANLLYQTKGSMPDRFLANEIKGNKFVSIYPNPIANKAFNLQFDEVPSGRYNFVLTDAAGRAVLAKTLNIGAKGQIEKVLLPRATGGGMYSVKLTGGDKKVVYSSKIVVQ